MKSIAFILAAAFVATAQTPGSTLGGQQLIPLAQPSSFDCAVDGSVVNAQTGEPIARAHVTLQSGGASAPSTSTDSSGRWSLSNVACMPGPAMATRPGFLQRASRSVFLASGSPVHDVKIELTPQSVFYGKVTDDEGDPVLGAGITVFVLRVAEGRATFQTSMGGNTNDLGEYRVSGLSRGKYIVCANLNAGSSRGDGRIGQQTCYPGPVDGGNASALDVPAGRETQVDLTLRETKAVHVRGTVTGVPEERNIGLNMVPRGQGGAIAARGGNARGGKFDIMAPPGSYMIAADYFEAGKHLLARVPIEVGSSDVDNVVVNVDSGFTLSGLVRFDPQARQTGFKSQFGMNLRPAEPSTGAGQLKWDVESRSFSFTDMAPGTYRFDVYPPSPYYVKSATLGGQDILNNEFTVSQAAGPIEVVLSDDSGSIEGDVVNADGQPAAGGVIALRNGRAATIPSTGHFKLQNLAPGDYTVYAWDDTGQVQYADQEWMRRYAGSGEAVTVTAGQNSQVKLTQQKVPE